MKRILALLVSGAMVIGGLSGCGGKEREMAAAFDSETNIKETFHTLEYEVPNTWEIDDTQGKRYFPEGGIAFLSAFDGIPLDIFDNEVGKKSFFDNISDTSEDFKLESEEIKEINGLKCYDFIVSGKPKNTNEDINYERWVFFVGEEKIISFSMGTYEGGGYDYTEDFDKVINSVKQGTPTFDFTKDEFVEKMDERLKKGDSKPLSRYRVQKEEQDIDGVMMPAYVYFMADDVSLTITANKDTNKVIQVFVSGNFSSLKGKEAEDYGAILAACIIVIEPYEAKEVYDTIGLSELDKVSIAKGDYGYFLYIAEDGVGKLSITPC